MNLFVASSFWAMILIRIAGAHIVPAPPMCILDINQVGIYSINGANYEMKYSTEGNNLLDIILEKK